MPSSRWQLIYLCIQPNHWAGNAIIQPRFHHNFCRFWCCQKWSFGRVHYHTKRILLHDQENQRVGHIIRNAKIRKEACSNSACARRWIQLEVDLLSVRCCILCIAWWPIVSWKLWHWKAYIIQVNVKSLSNRRKTHELFRRDYTSS